MNKDFFRLPLDHYCTPVAEWIVLKHGWQGYGVYVAMLLFTRQKEGVITSEEMENWQEDNKVNSELMFALLEKLFVVSGNYIYHPDIRRKSKSRRQTIEDEINASPELSKAIKEILTDFEATLPDRISVTNTMRDNWLNTLKRLVVIEGRDVNEVRDVVSFGRTDSFWKTNFFSLMKLRNKNKDGVLYYDVFLHQLEYQLYKKGGKDGEKGKRINWLFAKDVPRDA